MKINIEKGRYWDEGIELISGCTPISPGCEHCWSAGIAHRFSGKHGRLDKATVFTDNTRKFDGTILTHPERLTRFNKKRPTVFAIWNDLFHESVPEDFIFKTFTMMESSYWNTFLILTKRADRMSRILSHPAFPAIIRKYGYDWLGPKKYNERGPHWRNNQYFGLTVCNQEEADAKIPIFLQVPGKKFLSIEPMLGEIDLCWISNKGDQVDCLRGMVNENDGDGCFLRQINKIDAVILGGETGPGARPMHPDWVRSVRDQCAAAGVDFFFKQWGSNNDVLRCPDCQSQVKIFTVSRGSHGELSEYGFRCQSCSFQTEGFVKDGKEKTAIREYVSEHHKKRILDGRTHDELPWRKDAENPHKDQAIGKG